MTRKAIIGRCVRAGAQDFLERDKVNATALVRCVKYAIERNRLISELKKKTREVEDSKQRLRGIIDSNLDGMVIVDRQGQVQFVNPPAMQMLDCKSPVDMIGTPFGQPLVSGDKTEIELLSRSGGKVTAEMRIAEIQWFGKPAHLVLLHDITERKQMEETLQRLAYRVETRTDSLEALNLFKSDPGRFDLVITDLTMPNMTGDMLAQELMRIRKDIPVILCTGFSKKITEKTAKDLGIAAFILKPLVTEQIAVTIRTVLNRDHVAL